MAPSPPPSSSSSSNCISYDEALVQHVGQFGAGQMRLLVWAALSNLANALAFFLMVFATTDPVANRQWACSSASDAACQAVWQLEQPTSQDVCGLSPAQWHWTSTGERACGGVVRACARGQRPVPTDTQFPMTHTTNRLAGGRVQPRVRGRMEGPDHQLGACAVSRAGVLCCCIQAT
jgi:hypothetical protein